MKVWDYEFSLKGPGSNQLFIGHANPINSLSVLDGGKRVISVGGEEGIFIWEFLGYCGKNERYIDLKG